MFTGIIESLGIITSIKEVKTGKDITVSAKSIINNISLHDEILINGIRLEVSKKSKYTFSVNITPSLIEQTNIGDLEKKTYVNIERPMKMGSRFKGHLIKGNIDTIGVVLEKYKADENYEFVIGMKAYWVKYCIENGSVSIDGLSLIIMEYGSNFIKVRISILLLNKSNMQFKEKGDTLNIETDMIGKYFENFFIWDDDIDHDTESFKKNLMTLGFGDS
jgi:riboflavin synthase